MVDEMKVTQSSPEKVFDPITIVLETEDEAMLIWASLNASTRGILEEGGMQLTLPESCMGGLDSVSDGMWVAFRQVYDAMKGKYAK